MNPRPGVKDVAKLAGVGVSSASRALTGHADVSAKTRAKVLAAAQQLGYVVDVNAASLRSGRTNSVGVVVRDFSSPLYAGILAGIESVLDAHGLTMLVLNSHGDGERSQDLVRVLQARRVDAILLSLDQELDGDLSERLLSTRLPAVLIDRELPSSAPDSWGAVHCDHFAGVTAAMQALVMAGHSRIAFAGSLPTIRPWRERLRAYRESLAGAGIRHNARYELLGASPESVGAQVSSLLTATRGAAPTAVVAGGAQICVRTLSELQKHSINVGRDISFVTCDDLDLLSLMTPPIDVVDRDRMVLGQTAASLLLELLDGAAGRVQLTPTRYLARGSVVSLG